MVSHGFLLEEEKEIMRAVVTGASSGLGREFAIILDEMGYDVVAVARREERLNELKKTLKNNTQIRVLDLSKTDDIKKLFDEFPDADVLINNAGFGVFGEFLMTDLDKEMSMIDVNIKALHMLTKLYIGRMHKRNSGYILNVASAAAFYPGPVFSSYYASKAYVYRLSRAIRRELKKEKSGVSLSVLCPGPVKTELGDVADVHFGIGGPSANWVCRYAIKKMFLKKTVIVPGFLMKCTRVLSKLLPDCIGERVVYMIQKQKKGL